MSEYVLPARADRRLTSEEEKELSLLIQAGDEAAREVLTETNMRLALDAAHRVDRANGGTHALDDLYGEAMVILLRAVDLYDGSRGRFSTLCVPLLLRGLQLYLDRYESSALSIPENTARLMPMLRRDRARLTNELRRLPTTAELADAVGIEERHLQDLLDAISHTAELEEADAITAAAEYHDPSPLPEARRYDARRAIQGPIFSMSLMRAFNEADLTAREVTHLAGRFDLSGAGHLTLREIAGLTGWSVETVRRDVNSAMTKLADLVSAKPEWAGRGVTSC